MIALLFVAWWLVQADEPWCDGVRLLNAKVCEQQRADAERRRSW